jgi:hypothetical protein
MTPEVLALLSQTVALDCLSLVHRTISQAGFSPNAFRGVPNPNPPGSSNLVVWEAKKDLARCRVLIFVAQTENDLHNPDEWFGEALTLLARQSPRAALFQYCFASHSQNPSVRVVDSPEALAAAIAADLGSVPLAG